MIVAIPDAALLGFAARTVAQNSFSIFPAAPEGFAPPAMPGGWRNGVSGCERSSCWMSPTVRSFLSFQRCCVYSLSTSAGFWAHSARRPCEPSCCTSRPQPARSLSPVWWPPSRPSDRKSTFTPMPISWLLRERKY